MGASRRPLTDQPVADGLLGPGSGSATHSWNARERDYELSSVARGKLEGGDAMIALCQSLPSG